MDKDVDWVIVGRFGRTHGIKGQITVHSFTEPRDNLLQYTDWHAFIAKRWQPVTLLRIDATEKHILVTVKGYAEREEVAALTNIDIGVCRSQLPKLPSGEYYWHELIGLRVVNEQGNDLGVVTEILPTGSNDVLVVEGEKRHLIPYILNQFVLSIDKDKREMRVDWDEDF